MKEVIFFPVMLLHYVHACVYLSCVCVYIYIYNYSHLVLTQQFYEVGRLIFISHMGKVRQRDIDYFAHRFTQLINGGSRDLNPGLSDF